MEIPNIEKLPHNQPFFEIKPGTPVPPAKVLEVAKLFCDEVQIRAEQQAFNAIVHRQPGPGSSLSKPNMPPPQTSQVQRTKNGGGNKLVLLVKRRPGDPQSRRKHHPQGTCSVQAGRSLDLHCIRAGFKHDQMQGLHRLKELLQTPKFPDQKRQILEILQAVPSVKAAYTRQSQAHRHTNA